MSGKGTPSNLISVDDNPEVSLELQRDLPKTCMQHTGFWTKAAKKNVWQRDTLKTGNRHALEQLLNSGQKDKGQ
jgi:hypothetical protein